jgi:hypothetical protein
MGVVWALPLVAAVACGSSGSGDGGLPGVDGGGVDGGMAGNDGASGEAGGEAGSTPDVTPITGTTADTWAWVPFDQALCRDGTSTGIGVNMHSGATKLMIFLEGGGACFNALTCIGNPSHFDQTDFTTLTTTGYIGTSGSGVFDRSDPANPVKDWNFVYVPYCTGDVHAGDNPAGTVVGQFEVDGGLKPQAFVGYRNIGLYLDRVVPTFAGATQVLLTGVSAGGFGAAANYGRVAKAFGSVPVTLLDDSGPPMDSPHVAQCESSEWLQLWGLDKTLLADCGSSCANDGHFLIDYVKHAAAMYPGAPMGLVDSTGDAVITSFFGFGADDCTMDVQETADDFTAGLQDIRSQLAGNSNFGAYIFSGTRHTTLESSADLDAQTVPAAGDAGTVALTDWITQLLAGKASNAGP